jgi:hypothetical protein
MKLLLFTSLLSFLPIEGLLPPLYEGIKELQTLLASPLLAQKLQAGDVIEKIEKTEKGYKVTTNKRELEITLHYSSDHKIGPADFTLEFGEPEDI